MTNRMEQNRCLTCGTPLVRDAESEPGNPFASIACTACEKKLKEQYWAHRQGHKVLKNTKRLQFNIGGKRFDFGDAKKRLNQ